MSEQVKRFRFPLFQTWLKQDELEKRIEQREQYKLSQQTITEEVEAAIEYLFKVLDKIKDK